MKELDNFDLNDKYIYTLHYRNYLSWKMEFRD